MSLQDIMASPEIMAQLRKEATELFRKELEPILMQTMEDSRNDAIDMVLHLLDCIEGETINISQLKGLVRILKGNGNEPTGQE